MRNKKSLSIALSLLPLYTEELQLAPRKLKDLKALFPFTKNPSSQGYYSQLWNINTSTDANTNENQSSNESNTNNNQPDERFNMNEELVVVQPDDNDIYEISEVEIESDDNSSGEEAEF